MDELGVGLIFMAPALVGIMLAAALVLRAVRRDERNESRAERQRLDRSRPAWIGPPDFLSDQLPRSHQAEKAA
jgi:hypothetical protein